MGTTRMKAIELVIDWNLWPRQSIERLDATNLARMRDALRSGFSLPAVIVNKADFRVVDGFHRTAAVLDVFGDDAEIDVDLRTYADENEMVLEAGRTNMHHGLPMSPKDRAHFIIMCRRRKIPPAAIAEALYTNPKAMKEFIKNRTAKTETGETIPLSHGARNLAGKTLTPVQEHYARTSTGSLPGMYASMLLNALRADALLLSDKVMHILEQLQDEITKILDEAA